MKLYELYKYRKLVLFAKYVKESQTNSVGVSDENLSNDVISYKKRREQAIAYLDEQTNAMFDIYREKDKNGNSINKPKVLQLTLFK